MIVLIQVGEIVPSKYFSGLHNRPLPCGSQAMFSLHLAFGRSTLLINSSHLYLTALKRSLAARLDLAASSPISCELQHASFWNFTRQDNVAAYVNKRATQMSPKDTQMWRMAGLDLDEDGTLTLETVQSGQDHRAETSEQRRRLSQSLVWILSCIINLIAVDAGQNSSMHSPGELDSTSLEWTLLATLLIEWRKRLHFTFQPYGRVEAPSKLGSMLPLPNSIFPELVFSRADDASMMADFHFAKILILLNRPRSLQGSGATQLREYRDLMKSIDSHSREICGIANGRPHVAARLHLIQPLYLAGQCLEGREERKAIVQFLRDIELDSGIATEYRVKELLHEWRTSGGFQDHGI